MSIDPTEIDYNRKFSLGFEILPGEKSPNLYWCVVRNGRDSIVWHTEPTENFFEAYNTFETWRFAIPLVIAQVKARLAN